MDDKMWIKRMPDDYYNHPSFCSDIFLTQKTGDICEGWHKNRMNISEKDSLFLLAYMNQYLLEMSECLYDVAPDSHELKWIVNFDLDMFFYHDGDGVSVQLFSDDYIREVGKLLQNALDNIQVLTIAISPDCLAGKDMKEKWDNGFRVLKLLSDNLYGLWEFPFPR